MNKAELKKRISEVLGVSSTQSEIAYEIFLEKLSKFFNYGITLKVPHIGFFQLKENFEDKSQQILFANLPEDYTSSSKNFYLTLELHNKSKNNIEIDSQIFSIGVGKPLLPLVDENSEHQSEISFEILKKSIEERAKELLSESDQIPNYNIWDEFIYEDNDENLFDIDTDANQMVIENEIDTSKNLIDKLLSHTDFTIENDFYEDEKKNEIKSYDINEEVNDIDIIMPDNLSVDSLLDDEYEIEEKNESALKNIESSPDVINFIETSETNEKIKQISTFADELKNQIDELEKISNEIIGDKNYIENKEENKDELISITENENIVQPQFDKDYSQNLNPISFENDINIKSTDDEVNLSTLLEDEQQKNIADEIKIEPPASSKELIIDELFISNNEIINIEENELKQIVKNEVDNFNKNYNEENNSEVLNKLLTEEQLKKIEINDNETDNDNEQNPLDEKIKNKIEWNWGDELKEEFGIGNLNNFEVLESDKSDEVIDNKLEFIDEEISENYEDSPTIELRKTRVDLFTKLEETLEREINFLNQDIEESEKDIIFDKPEVNDNNDQNLINSKNIIDESANEIEFKDEKVILDFKTPPPQYEFIEEKPVENEFRIENQNEPLLRPPKKITIILSPEEQENLIEKKTITKTLDNSETEVEIIQQPKEKKNYWKLISIILGSILVLSVTIFVVLKYIYSSEQIKNNIQSGKTNASKTEDKQNQEVTITENKNQNTADALSVEEYSDFPITATPPKPVKSGNEINIQQLIPKTEKVETKTITPVEKKNETSNFALNKNQVTETKFGKENKTVEKLKTQNEVRLSNLIFFDGKNYSFQTSSWKNKALAETEMSRLRSLGFNAFISEAYLPQKGGTWYRVRIGYFSTEQEAFEFKKKNNF